MVQCVDLWKLLQEKRWLKVPLPDGKTARSFAKVVFALPQGGKVSKIVYIQIQVLDVVSSLSLADSSMNSFGSISKYQFNAAALC